MTVRQLRRITDMLEQLDKRYKQRKQELFDTEGVTQEEYYDAFWKDWEARR